MTKFNDCKLELDSYLRLPAGWDGYRGKIPLKSIVDIAKDITDTIKKYLCVDEIIPGCASDGSVDVEINIKEIQVFFILILRMKN